MDVVRRRGLLFRPGCAALALAALMAGCGKPAAPATDAAAEQAEARKRASERAYGGDAVKALEAAKSLETDINKKATDSVDRIEKDAK